MSSHSERTIRACGVPNDTSEKVLISTFRASHMHDIVVSLAPQSETQTATITFPSTKMKNQALGTQNGWNIDDTFIGISVLHSDPEPILDVVAVHGLGGNAFDTFAWDYKHMWLRDFLPTQPQLNKTRTMTFGYNSNPQDSSNNEGVREWASALLRGVASVRESPAERSRPIIFVCHSLGGLVARGAMAMLGRDPQSYEGLELKYCGILFLATPHSGSKLADWDDIFAQLARLAGIRGNAIKSTLQSFNSGGMIAKEDFGRLSPIPRYKCLYETRKMRIGLKRRIVVEADSASLNAVIAQPMADVDHRQICKFKHNTDPGYKQVVACLRDIQDEIAKANAPHDHDEPQQVSPQPNRSNNTDVGLLPPGQDASWAPDVSQVPVSPGIRGGRGTGGDIQVSDSSINMGGGHATGATMSLPYLRGFQGTVRGGIGDGSVIQ